MGQMLSFTAEENTIQLKDYAFVTNSGVNTPDSTTFTGSVSSTTLNMVFNFKTLDPLKEDKFTKAAFFAGKAAFTVSPSTLFISFYADYNANAELDSNGDGNIDTTINDI